MRHEIAILLDIEDFSSVHRHKDVCELPNEIAIQSECEVKLFVWENLNQPQLVPSKNFQIIQLKYPKWTRKVPFEFIRAAFRCFLLYREAKSSISHAKLLVLFHFKPQWAIPLMAFRKRPEWIHIKMDLSQKFLAEIIGYEQARFSIKKLLAEILLRFLGSISVESESMLEEIRKSQIFGSKFQKKLHVIPNGVSPEFLHDKLAPKKEKWFITIGRLGTQQKNTELLVEAFIRAKLDGWKLVLVGPETANFNRWRSALMGGNPHAKESILFFGEITDREQIKNLLARSLVFCLPSRWEGSALSLFEAMAQKCCLLCTPVGSGPDLIIPEHTGFFAESESISDWIEKLRYIGGNPQKAQEMGEAAYVTVKRHYLWPLITEKLLGITMNGPCPKRQPNVS